EDSCERPEYDVSVGRGRLFALLLAVLIGVSAPASSLADGDPASDVLASDDVFLPYPAPAKTPSDSLRRAVASAYRHGYRLKVAVVATPNDLGAIPSLFNKPTEYAKFLGAEISFMFVGPLLILMPAGFGIFVWG